MFSATLRALRRQKKMSQNELAREVGVSQQAVGKWETGRCLPDTSMLRRLSGVFGVTVDALLRDTGATPASRIRTYGAEREVMVPVLGTVRAGYGALALQEECGEEPAFVRNPSDYFYLIVRGDSMQPRIQDGDLALVHRQATLDSGNLGVIVFGDDGEGTLKKYLRRGNAVVLQPFNPAYQPQIIEGDELDRLYIAGKVVETKAKW